MLKRKGTHSVKNLPTDFDKIKDECLDRIKLVKNSQYTRFPNNELGSERVKLCPRKQLDHVIRGFKTSRRVTH